MSKEVIFVPDRAAGFNIEEHRSLVNREDFKDQHGVVDFVALMNKCDEVGIKLQEESRLIRQY